jgi:uncharacterized membrane protein
MHKVLRSMMKPWVKALMAIGLVVVLSFGHADGALAARGGRMGGGSFRAPSRSTYSAPRSYAPGGGYGGGYNRGYYPGGGFGFPFLFPFFSIGGGAGGLFSILIFLAVANFLVQSFRRSRSMTIAWVTATRTQRSRLPSFKSVFWQKQESYRLI